MSQTSLRASCEVARLWGFRVQGFRVQGKNRMRHAFWCAFPSAFPSAGSFPLRAAT